MAVPTSTRFVEDYYGSKMDLSLDMSTMEVTGRYRARAPGGMLGGHPTLGRHEVLKGRLQQIPGAGAKLDGEFAYFRNRHEVEAERSGNFSVGYEKESGNMVGWFEWADEKGVQVPWTWTQTGGLWSWWHDLAMSIHIVRWVLLCCWVYIPTTAIGWILAFLTDPAYGGHVGLCLNWGFYLNYMVTYYSFLFWYVFMKPRPPRLYMLGIALYTFGYHSFFMLYSMSLFQITGPVVAAWLNTMGSLLFLTGSMALIPPTVKMAAGVWSPAKKAASLFWGSFFFLAGSILFSWDALLCHAGEVSQQWKICYGMGLFLVGRVFFLWGSTTPECNFWFMADKVTPVKSTSESDKESA